MPEWNASNQEPRPQRLSYKFQRLREQLRAAILNGEFGDRLPGERELGRRYHANAKTVNKALSDLSSEGLLARHIGRGTFLSSKKDGEESASRSSSLRIFAGEAGHGVSGNRSEEILRLMDSFGARSGCQIQTTRCRVRAEQEGIDLSDWPSLNRRDVDGIIFIPAYPLGQGKDRPCEDVLLEAHRRRISTVLVGACTQSAKLNAVAPDYVDAGFRLAEHHIRSGCTSVIVVHTGESSEVALTLSGCRTACVRHHASIQTHHLKVESMKESNADLLRMIDQQLKQSDLNRVEPPVGVICVGAPALDHFRKVDRLTSWCESGEIAVNCLTDGDRQAAERYGVTHYDFDFSKIAEWSLRLVQEMRPGARPAEIIVPGVLNICGLPVFKPSGSGDSESQETKKLASSRSEQLIEAIL